MIFSKLGLSALILSASLSNNTIAAPSIYSNGVFKYNVNYRQGVNVALNLIAFKQKGTWDKSATCENSNDGDVVAVINHKWVGNSLSYEYFEKKTEEFTLNLIDLCNGSTPTKIVLNGKEFENDKGIILDNTEAKVRNAFLDLESKGVFSYSNCVVKERYGFKALSIDYNIAPDSSEALVFHIELMGFEGAIQGVQNALAELESKGICLKP